ncbi:hypothetical protein DPEC_G00358670 [Dallia pectoralis]|uniref:Uncharacterized protein n=1 Tax=Dallia pectoralis TaxID=75939 RepID=A0ACC2F0B7_DALPE|nr:hypothetical protein DPEC_G00358670 [Dallia pectoralis]
MQENDNYCQTLLVLVSYQTDQKSAGTIRYAWEQVLRLRGSPGLEDAKKIYNFCYLGGRRISENCPGMEKQDGRSWELLRRKPGPIVRAGVALPNYLHTSDTDNTD